VKTLLILTLTALSLSSASAFETAQGVTATPITALPFTITAPGNYYLPADLTATAPGAAITVNADQVVLDLNGRTLKATGAAASPLVGIGVAVLNHEDVTIQNGDIDKFGYIGVLFDATDGKREHNFKNQVNNVRFNSDEIGVLTVSGSLVDVENSFFEEGSVGIYDVNGLGGDRFQKNSFEAQKGVESLNSGIGIVDSGVGALMEDNEFADEQTIGILDNTKFGALRFNSFINDGAKFIGGRSLGFGDN
jgi:hypothetical protein